jgi:hypothetical protein
LLIMIDYRESSYPLKRVFTLFSALLDSRWCGNDGKRKPLDSGLSLRIQKPLGVSLSNLVFNRLMPFDQIRTNGWSKKSPRIISLPAVNRSIPADPATH